MSLLARKHFLLLAVFAASLHGAWNAQAQESWQGSPGGASHWTAGTMAKPAQVSHASGGGAGWVAGRGSFGTTAQPGGVWHEGAAQPAQGDKTSAKNLAAAGTPTPGGAKIASGSSLPSGIKPATASSHGATPQRTSQSAHATTGSHTAAGNTHNGASPFHSSRTTASARQSSSGKSGTSSSFGSTADSSPSLNPLGGASAKGSGNSGLSTSLDEPLH